MGQTLYFTEENTLFWGQVKAELASDFLNELSCS
jgi:hypothetical protein